MVYIFEKIDDDKKLMVVKATSIEVVQERLSYEGFYRLVGSITENELFVLRENAFVVIEM